MATTKKLLDQAHSKIPKITEYCLGVLAGEIVTNELVRLAVERHLNDLEHGADRGLRFDEKSALRIIRFHERVLPLVEGEGKRPFLLSPWQQFVQGNLFGWKGADGYRRFRTAYIEIGKGSGKSPMAAGTALYGLFADGENAAEIYLAATKKDQAKIVFRDADNMVAASRYLSKHIQRNTNNLAVPSTASFLRAISADTRGIDGPRPHITVVDEVHELRDALLIDKLRAGTKGRRQALQYEITNSGHNRHSVCYAHHEYSAKLLRGILENDSWFAFVCGLDPCEKCKEEGKDQPNPECKNCDDWKDERVWPKANPNLGVSIHHKYLREMVAEAVGMPTKENIVKRLNFCIWTESANAWMPPIKWDECADDYTAESLAGKICYGGLDLASVLDLAALVLYFPESNRVLAYFWVPEENVASRIEKDLVPYDLWIKQKFIATTQGNVTDYDVIRQDIEKIAGKFRIEEIGYDPDNATQLANQLTNEGLKMIASPPFMSNMSAPMKELERLVLGRELKHDRNPVLRWNISNLVAVQDSCSRIRPDHEKSSEKIDGAVSLIHAVGRAMVHTQRGSIYEEREMIVL